VPRVAVLDLGTNSTRLLIADVQDGHLEELDRRTAVTRLGERVEATGRLQPAAIERVCETLVAYRRAIDERRVDRIESVATSAVRDATNGDELRATLRERFGLEARTLSGDEEARLTFLGATSGRSSGDASTLVIDIGGGSTEFVIGAPGEAPDFHVSTQAGSVRHTERHLAHDPPTTPEVRELRSDVRQLIERSVRARVRARVTKGIAVAGTATSLAAIDQRLNVYDRSRVDGYELQRPACERMLAELAALPLERRREVVGLNPARAPTIVAGAAVLVESMEAFALERVETSESDILHGVAITAGT